MRVARGYAVDDPGAPAHVALAACHARLARGRGAAHWRGPRLGRSSPLSVLRRGHRADRLRAAHPAGCWSCSRTFTGQIGCRCCCYATPSLELAEHPVAIAMTTATPCQAPLRTRCSTCSRADAVRAIPLAGLDVDAVAAWLPQLTDYATPKLAAALHSRTGATHC